MNTQKLDYNKLHCSLCHNEIPPGAFFIFMKCEKCEDIIHDACYEWISPKIIKNIDEGTELWIPFCQFCGDNKYRIITPKLWKTPNGRIVETSTIWEGKWTGSIL